jgi:pyruvate/2-oxoacid:ferredoxin oxidoreductase alpha subunit
MQTAAEMKTRHVCEGIEYRLVKPEDIAKVRAKADKFEDEAARNNVIGSNADFARGMAYGKSDGLLMALNMLGLTEGEK